MSGRLLPLRHQTSRDAETYSQQLESLIELAAKSGLEIAIKVGGKRLQLIRNNIIKEMAERRKIIIPTGANTDESLPAPHFDAEATLSARRVVPLSEQETEQLHYAHYAQPAAIKPFWRRPMIIALLVLVAASLGVAAGFAIGIYKNRNANSTVNAQPTENPTQIAQQPQLTPTPQPRATVSPAKTGETPAEMKGEERDDKDQDRKATVRNQPNDKDDKSDEVTPPPPPTARDKKRDDGNSGDQVFDEKQAERQRRREERRRQRDEDETLDVPHQIQRARDRIRDIFEGRQP